MLLLAIDLRCLCHLDWLARHTAGRYRNAVRGIGGIAFSSAWSLNSGAPGESA
jgi:hypothetical protein